MLLLGLVGCDDTLFGVIGACAGCHIGGGEQGGLTLDAGSEVLVDVAATEAPELSLIVFGDPSASYLWLKVTDAPGIVGSPMPPGQSLSTGELGTVENWITKGP